MLNPGHYCILYRNDFIDKFPLIIEYDYVFPTEPMRPQYCGICARAITFSETILTHCYEVKCHLGCFNNVMKLKRESEKLTKKLTKEPLICSFCGRELTDSFFEAQPFEQEQLDILVVVTFKDKLKQYVNANCCNKEMCVEEYLLHLNVVVTLIQDANKNEEKEEGNTKVKEELNTSKITGTAEKPKRAIGKMTCESTKALVKKEDISKALKGNDLAYFCRGFCVACLKLRVKAFLADHPINDSCENCKEQLEEIGTAAD